MKSVLDYRNAAKKERQKADGYRQQSMQHRTKADAYEKDQDYLHQQEEIKVAQGLDQKASEHDKAALDYEQVAADLEARALQLEEQKQIEDANRMKQSDAQDAQIKALRGE